MFYVPAIYTTTDNQTFVSLITTEPKDFVAEFHNRMPVIFDFDKAADFIEDNNNDTNIDRCSCSIGTAIGVEKKNV